MLDPDDDDREFDHDIENDHAGQDEGDKKNVTPDNDDREFDHSIKNDHAGRDAGDKRNVRLYDEAQLRKWTLCDNDHHSQNDSQNEGNQRSRAPTHALTARMCTRRTFVLRRTNDVESAAKEDTFLDHPDAVDDNEGRETNDGTTDT